VSIVPLRARYRLIPYVAAVVIGAAAVACGDASGPGDGDLPADIVFTPGLLRAHVAVLADDSLCGRAAGTPYERRAALYVSGRFAAFGLEPGAPDFLAPFPLGATAPRADGSTPVACADSDVTVSQNVLGALPGAGPLAAQWIMLGAHYDHVGWQVQSGQVAVFNGADDNASGTAVVLETARLLSQWVAAHAATAGNRRSILFAAFGAEELGLVGSSSYAAGVGVPLDSLVAMVNLDMVGRLRDNTLTVQGTLTAPEWPAMLSAANADGLVFLFTDDYLGASDQYPFIQRGIPAVHLFTGLHPDYHTPRDDVGLLNTEGMATVSRLAVTVLWDLATRAVPPGRAGAVAGGLAERARGR
jgi:hypothetical protein